MLDEEMDDIIRNAAAKDHPAYNDQAWEMMEKKLVKHLPQKKDPRRFIFFLLFFLLLGSGAVLTAVYFTGNNNSVSKGVTEKNRDSKPLTTEPNSQKNTAVNDPVANVPGENSNATEQIERTAPNTVTNTNAGQQRDNN